MRGALTVRAALALRAVTPEVAAMPAALPWLVGGAVGLAALAASWLPARRATRVQPVEVMRAE